jgi:hypothetical protein
MRLRVEESAGALLSGVGGGRRKLLRMGGSVNEDAPERPPLVELPIAPGRVEAPVG